MVGVFSGDAVSSGCYDKVAGKRVTIIDLIRVYRRVSMAIMNVSLAMFRASNVFCVAKIPMHLPNGLLFFEGAQYVVLSLWSF